MDKIIADKWYTPYEITLIGAFKRKSFTGETIKYKYAGILQIIKKDLKKDNELQIRTERKSDKEYFYILGQNLINFLKKYNHKYQ